MFFRRNRITVPEETNFEELIAEYVTYLETQPTNKVCLCVWEKPKVTGAIRATPVQHNPRCPVHSKEGLILGFINWMSRGRHR